MVDTFDATVAFADLAGFTALTEVYGDFAAAEIAAQLGVVTESILTAGDRLVKGIGDAVLVTSLNAASGISLVDRLFGACEQDPRFPYLRAGLHYGAVVERGGDIFGATVNIAARVAGLAAGGQILATRPIADAAPKTGVTIRELGSTRLHNVSTPVELFSLIRAGGCGHDIDPVCRMLLTPATAVGRLGYAGNDYLFCSLACAAKFAADPDRFTVAEGPAI